MGTLFSVLVAEVAVAALVWSGFVAHYHIATHGRWRTTRHGRNVMSLAACLAVMVDLTLLSVVVESRWILFAALVLWPLLAVIGAHRHRLLWLDQHAERNPR